MVSSTIIRDIEDIRKVGLASMAFFYCDFRDEEKQTRRGLLSSLLVQFCAQSDTYCNILSKLYSGHNDGSQYPSDSALEQCLSEMLNYPGQAPIYIIVDALDECPKTSDTPSSREKVLKFLEQLVNRSHPNLHYVSPAGPSQTSKLFLLHWRSIRCVSTTRSGKSRTSSTMSALSSARTRRCESGELRIRSSLLIHSLEGLMGCKTSIQ